MTATLGLLRRDGCPKRMVHGPCGGVQANGDCEVGRRPCPFLGPGSDAGAGASARSGAEGSGAAERGRLPEIVPAARHARSAAGAELLALMDLRPVVVADLPSVGPDAGVEQALAAALAGRVDAALLGDAPWSRLQFPPAVRAGLVAAEGLRPWSGVNCRDRNRTALQAELAALELGGVGGIHCVTGDHPLLGDRPDATPVFDLDSTALATLAAGRTGAVVSVAESPDAPIGGGASASARIEGRAARAAAKAAAGADLLFVNHTADRATVGEFAAAVRALAPGLRLIACVPLVVSAASAERVARFLHGPLPDELLAPLAAPDPVAAAIRLAVEHAEALLALPEIDGVDLSAPAGPGEHLLVAEALAVAGTALGAGS